MYKKIIVLALLKSISLGAMEVDAQAGTKMPEINGTPDIVKMWGRFNCELNREEKDVLQLFTLFACLKVLSAADAQFLSVSQKHDWKVIMSNSFLALVHGRCDMFLDEEKNTQQQKVLSELMDYAYPDGYYCFKLNIIKWAKEKARTAGWDVAWPQVLQLKEDGSEMEIHYSASEITDKRLAMLRIKKHNSLNKLAKVRNQLQKKAPISGDAII